MNKAICPICNGTKRKPCPPLLKEIINNTNWNPITYDIESDTVECTNCGGQYPGQSSSGYVGLRKDGSPCIHDYIGRMTPEGATQYQCEHCGDRYDIDDLHLTTV